jgi:hypothetical protein
VVQEGLAIRQILQVSLDTADPKTRQREIRGLCKASRDLGCGNLLLLTEKELRMDVKRVGRMVRQTATDAWVVGAGSREVLEWFAAQPLPAFALFGRRDGLPLAGVGPDMVSAHVCGHAPLEQRTQRIHVRLTQRGKCSMPLEVCPPR